MHPDLCILDKDAILQETITLEDIAPA